MSWLGIEVHSSTIMSLVFRNLQSPWALAEEFHLIYKGSMIPLQPGLMLTMYPIYIKLALFNRRSSSVGQSSCFVNSRSRVRISPSAPLFAEVAEWSNAADCKSAPFGVHWFKSSPLHMYASKYIVKEKFAGLAQMVRAHSW